ncbi:MAG TPA: FliH/SctL family protein [Terriglobales bacterium]|nr:FliH/SctL family protein [Terriglobales bacterium]
MKSSFKAAPERGLTANVSPFCYPEEAGEQAGKTPGKDAALREELAREAGRQEGETQARAGFEQQLEMIHAQAMRAIAEFGSERATYFRRVEIEVVQLALAIARRVLHRESQIDPSLLSGLVRWALEKIDAGTAVQLRVHPADAAEFRSRALEVPNAKLAPEIIEDSSLARHMCVIHTELGSTEIGVELQFKEIEQGLLDLLSKRPQS